MNDNMLISTAIMSTLWETRQNDTLDLLLPFLKYSIGKTTQVGSSINIQKVIDFFKDEFGYETIPGHVITLMLNRLSPKILKKNNSEYYLVSSLDDEIDSLEKKRTIYKEQRTKVGESLSNYLSDNLRGNTEYDSNSAIAALINFFILNGICIVKETSFLSLLKSRDGKLDYCIARFILKEYNDSTEIFDYILNMVKVFFVSTAISLQPQNTGLSRAKFKNLQCYIDTRIIIDALGLHLPEAYKAANELLTMLKDRNASLCCFEHTVAEIADIISAYKNGISNPYYSYSHLTLEAWDKQNYKPTDVERYQSRLRSRIEALGIKIVEKPSRKNEALDVNGLETYISNNMRYNRPDALLTDVNSIASIIYLRNDSCEKTVEHCGYIFVTSNKKLACVANQFLNSYNERHVKPIMTDVDLASIVWLKCYSTHPDYPQTKLLENALLAVEPTQSLLDSFFEVIDKIKAEGGMTEDEAAILRTDLFCKRELANEVKGDEKAITYDTVLTIRDKLRNKYIGDLQGESNSNYQKYVEQRDEHAKSMRNAIDAIEKIGREIENKSKHNSIIFVSCAISVLALIFIITTIIGLIENSNIIWVGIVSFIFGIIGFYDMIIGRKKWINTLITKHAHKIADKKMDIKREEYERIFGELNTDRFI